MKKTDVYVVVDTPKKANYCTIQLTQGKYTIVDSDDFDLLNRYNWHFQSRGYACNEKLGLLHRFITNCPKGMVVDHINGDKLDNRKENLRICTQTQNTFNSKGVDNKTSKYKGVSWAKIKNKWKAQIHINKKNTYLGLFDSEIDAAKKYDEIAYSLYGDFAKLNFIRYATEEEKALLEPKKELEVGKWYNVGFEDKDEFFALIYITNIVGDRVYFYGFDNNDKWRKKDWFRNSLNYTEATTQEVEQALIEEAKRRGFNSGVYFSSTISEHGQTRLIERISDWYYNSFKNSLHVCTPETEWHSNQSNPRIFQGGKWATIIEQDKLSNLKEAFNNGYCVEFYDEKTDTWKRHENPCWNPDLQWRIMVNNGHLVISDVYLLNQIKELKKSIDEIKSNIIQ